MQDIVQLGYLQAPRLVSVELFKRRVHLEELLLFLPSLLAALDSLDLDRRRGQLLLLGHRDWLRRGGRLRRTRRWLDQILARHLTPVHSLDLHGGSLHLPLLLEFLARLFAAMDSLNFQRRIFHLVLLQDVAQRSRYHALHRRVQLVRVRRPQVVTRQALLVELLKLPKVQAPRVVRVVVLHQRSRVVVKLTLAQLQTQVGHHLAQLVNLQLPAAVGVKHIESSLDAPRLVDALSGLLTPVHSLDLERG